MTRAQMYRTFVRISLQAFVPLCVVLAVHAQTPAVARTASTSSWTIYTGDHLVSRNWALHLEGGGFWHGFVGAHALEYVRPGLRRTLPHDVSVMVTYSRFQIEPRLTGSESVPEHRMTENVEWKHSFGPVAATEPSVTQRLRLEQRMLNVASSAGGNTTWDVRGRLRYRPTLTYPFS